MAAMLLPAGSSEPVLSASGVAFAYDGVEVLHDVSVTLHPGEFVALVGPNGSGKSTLVRILLGLLSPNSGEALLFGEPPASLGERSRVGYVPQRAMAASDLPATVEEVVRAGCVRRGRWWRTLRPADRDAVDHALGSVALDNLRRRRVGDLSGGQQQRVLIAKALAGNPDLLVLDEPIAGIDAESQRLFRDSLVHLVKEHSAAILLVSHELGAVADDLDRVVVLKRTVVFDGPGSDLVATGVSLGVHREDLPLWLEGLN